jgi:hypothetical protein
MDKKLLCRIGDRSVFLVDGDAIRLDHAPDFVAGGNGYRYGFVPKDEIWIDDRITPDQRAFTIVHEFIETMLMERGEDYGTAHTHANEVERALRLEARRR